MYIRVRNENGLFKVNTNELKQFAAESIKMVPGVEKLGHANFVEKIKSLRNKDDFNSIKITILKRATINISCRIVVSSSTNFADVSRQIQRVLKYSIEKHYNINVDSIDVYVEGVVK